MTEISSDTTYADTMKNLPSAAISSGSALRKTKSIFCPRFQSNFLYLVARRSERDSLKTRYICTSGIRFESGGRISILVLKIPGA